MTVTRKNFSFTQTWKYNNKLYDTNKRKIGLLLFWVDQILNCVKMSWCSVYSFFIFLFGTVSFIAMVVFSKAPFWKLHNHGYVQTFTSKFVRYIENSILKNTLQLKILRIRGNSFIKLWIRVMKQKLTKVSASILWSSFE